nr:reverse transcriptase domain-containing protein [Candidatus Brachybacter algidus]
MLQLFFDNLNHRTLKKQWSKVLNETTLPQDHYNLFKALTNIKYIEGDQLFESYGNTMMVKMNLVISKNNSVGIPQGSPISATLANIYMLEFDQEIFDGVSSIGGFYQRYSDDLIIICEQQYEDDIIKLIREKIETVVDLKIEPNKTKVFRFEEVNGKFTGFEINEKTKIPNHNKTLEYLGFSYDGQRVLIKTSGFSKFYRSMKSTFKNQLRWRYTVKILTRVYSSQDFISDLHTEEQKENLFTDLQKRTKPFMKKLMNIIGAII